MKTSPSTLPLRFRFGFGLVLLLIGLPCSLLAQDLDNASIAGSVVDQNAAIIVGASISAVLNRTGFTRTVSLATNGRFNFPQVEPGTYTLRISAAGFETYERFNLVLIAGQTAAIDVVLVPQGLAIDQVTVIADEATIDTTRTIVGGTLTTKEIETLPIPSRSVLDLLFALPGITEEPLSTRDLAEDRHTNPANAPEEAGIFAVAGGPAYSNNLTIDGLDNNDDRAARERFQPSLEAVEEVQVVTNQFSAEYGRASGGRINVKTRGGAQDVRGRVFSFFKDEALNANTFRNNLLGLKRLPLQEHNPGFTVSGPLILPRFHSKRSFFFTSYELSYALDSALIDTLVPVQQNPRFALPGPTSLAGIRIEDASGMALSAEVAPFMSKIATPLRNQTFTVRFDHQFSEAHNGTALYQLGRLTNLRPFGGGNRLAEALQAKTRNSDALSYSDNYVFSARTINQARMQWANLTPSIEARGGNSPVVLISLNDPLPAADPAHHTGTLVAGSSTAGSTDRQESRWQIQDVLTHLSGAHTIKTGVDFQLIRSTFIDLADFSGTYSFASAGDFLANTPSRFRQNFLAESTQHNNYLGFFAQDDWRMLPHLTLSFGLRYERESIIPDGNNWAPRVSLAFDPFESGKTVLRAGVGVFYNRALLRTIDDFKLGAKQTFFDTNSLHDPATGRLLSAAQRREFIASHLSFPQTLSADSALVAQYGVLQTGFSRRLDPGLRIPESYQANVGVERDLGRGFRLEVNCTLNRGLHLWRELNVNAPRLPVGFRDFSEYLASRDFSNFRDGSSGLRPLYNASAAGELVRFVFNSSDPANPNMVGRVMEFGVPVSLVNLNSGSSTTAVEVALAALNDLRPDPTRLEVEQLVSAGNSFYRALTLEIRKHFSSSKTFGFAFRVGYTFSHLTDDGVVNTSDALTPGDFRHERARSLLDRRHRFVFSGTFELPRQMGRLRLSPVFRAAAGAPFNISSGGIDRNLDDVSNDRPDFSGNTEILRWRGPGETIEPSILDHFSQPTIGRAGTLPRNAGQGPGFVLFDLSVMREFRINQRMRLRPVIEFDNVLNKTVFSFGAEFINFNALGPSATAAQRQAFLDSFLLTTRTLRQRQLRLGIRVDF